MAPVCTISWFSKLFLKLRTFFFIPFLMFWNLGFLWSIFWREQNLIFGTALCNIFRRWTFSVKLILQIRFSFLFHQCIWCGVIRFRPQKSYRANPGKKINEILWLIFPDLLIFLMFRFVHLFEKWVPSKRINFERKKTKTSF